MKAVGVIAAIAIALALQTTLTRYAVTGASAVELALVVVVYVALTSGPVTGLLAGTLAGWSSAVLGGRSPCHIRRSLPRCCRIRRECAGLWRCNQCW